IAPGSVADPAFFAVENPGVALALRCREQPTRRAGTDERFGEPKTADLFEARHRRQPLLLLFFRPVDVDRTHCQTDMHAEERRERRIDPCEFHLDKSQQCEAPAGTAVAIQSNTA